MRHNLVNSISIVGLLLVLIVQTSCKTENTPPLFNGEFYSLEKFYGNIDSIEFAFYCEDQTFDKEVYNADTINGENLTQIVGKDMVMNNKKVPMKSPGLIVFENNTISNLEYRGAGITKYDFIYTNNLPAGYSTYVSGKISDIYEIIKTDEQGRIKKATITHMFFSSSPSVNSKEYRYNKKGYCNYIVQSKYYSSRYIYDDNGFVKEKITTTKSGQKSTSYKIVAKDKNNNWIKRLVINDGSCCNYFEERKIYYTH